MKNQLLEAFITKCLQYLLFWGSIEGDDAIFFRAIWSSIVVMINCKSADAVFVFIFMIQFSDHFWFLYLEWKGGYVYGWSIIIMLVDCKSANAVFDWRLSWMKDKVVM